MVRPIDEEAAAGEAGKVPRRGERSRGPEWIFLAGENPRADVSVGLTVIPKRKWGFLYAVNLDGDLPLFYVIVSLETDLGHKNEHRPHEVHRPQAGCPLLFFPFLLSRDKKSAKKASIRQESQQNLVHRVIGDGKHGTGISPH